MKKKDRYPPFVALTWQLLNSKAYKELTFAAGKVLPYFLGQVKLGYRDPERYKTQFRFSYTEAAGYGFSRETFRRSLKDLQGKGFIQRVSPGGLRGNGYGYSLYVLSRQWETL